MIGRKFGEGRFERTIASLVVASFTAALLLLAPIFAMHPTDWSGAGFVLSTFGIGLCVLYIPLGLCVHLVAMRVTSGQLLIYLVGAALLGAIISALLLPTALYVVDDTRTSWPLELQFLAVGYGTATGIAAAAVFWLVRRPDHDQQELSQRDD